MKCPDCKGRKPCKTTLTYGIDGSAICSKCGLRNEEHETCETCGGTGEVDKIREEFETQALNMGYSILKIDGQYIESLTVILHTGYLMGQQSYDEEIEKLKQACKSYQTACDNYKDKIIGKDEELKIAKEALILIPKWTSNKKVIRISKEALEEIT